LSSTTFFERIAALLFAQAWHLYAWCVLAGIGAALGGAPPLVTATIVIGGPCIVTLIAAIGYGCYALVPSVMDQRGPMLLVRVLASYVFALPAAGIGIVIGSLAHDAAIGLTTAGVIALAESTALVAFVAWRLEAAPAVTL
jgi:hypothetical protein